jgi:Luciferase-like monooxygenase
MRLSFGIKTSQMGLTYQDVLQVWLDAERVPLFEHGWLWDHMVPLRGDVRGAALEAWTLLGALAAQTQRLRLGVMVTSNRLRNPALLAKMAATVDVIAGGRLDFGIGAGGSQLPGAPEEVAAIVRREFNAYGVPIVPAGQAVGALAEACTLIRRMWTENGPFDFSGRYYQVRGAVCEPKPVQSPHPPFMIGAGGERAALRVVAEHADLWNCPARTAAEFRHKSRGPRRALCGGRPRPGPDHPVHADPGASRGPGGLPGPAARADRRGRHPPRPGAGPAVARPAGPVAGRRGRRAGRRAADRGHLTSPNPTCPTGPAHWGSPTRTGLTDSGEVTRSDSRQHHPLAWS